MTICELTYTPSDVPTSQEHPHTMVLMVDPDALKRYEKDKSIALASVVDSFTVMRYDNPGKVGKLVRPSRRELEDTFNTTNEDEIVKFMLSNGELHGKAALR